MKLVNKPEDATYAACLATDGAQGFTTEPDFPILMAYKRKGTVWALHSPTQNEAAGIESLISSKTKNAWYWIAP